ncbi:MAG: thiamine diphosphokinase [Bacteroidales bacterium]|nr:thiamine diphosphokinase [Bacteroidales bacterium]MBR1434393.1 thiamine diphosphokinase [Bacteroidales bacterium]
MGKIAAIIGAGDFPRKPYPRYLIGTADIIVCCDSAFRIYLKAMDKIFPGRRRLPDAVIGDFDSIGGPMMKKYGDTVNFIHVEEQDDNDQTKAVRYILSHFPEVDTIHILGAGGKREDHTIGNISLLMEYRRMFDLSGIEMDMVSDYSTIFAISDSCELAVGKGRRISILTPDNSLKIKSEGLVWPTDDVVFDNWWKATLNRASEDTVKLTFSHPSMAVIILD